MRHGVEVTHVFLSFWKRCENFHQFRTTNPGTAHGFAYHFVPFMPECLLTTGGHRADRFSFHQKIRGTERQGRLDTQQSHHSLLARFAERVRRWRSVVVEDRPQCLLLEYISCVERRDRATPRPWIAASRSTSVLATLSDQTGWIHGSPSAPVSLH